MDFIPASIPGTSAGAVANPPRGYRATLGRTELVQSLIPKPRAVRQNRRSPWRNATNGRYICVYLTPFRRSVDAIILQVALLVAVICTYNSNDIYSCNAFPGLSSIQPREPTQRRLLPSEENAGKWAIPHNVLLKFTITAFPNAESSSFWLNIVLCDMTSPHIYDLLIFPFIRA